MSRIDILTLESKYYTFENDSARKLHKAFSQLNISSQIIPLQDGHLPDYLLYLKNSPPKWTLSFEDILKRRIPLCDIVKIPHLYWLQNSFSPAAHFLEAHFAKVGVIDRSLCKAAPQLTFIPPPVEIQDHIEEIRPFDVVLFAKLVDVENKKKTWKEIFPISEYRLLEENVSYYQKNPSISPIFSILKENGYERLSRNDLFQGIEEILKGDRIRELVESCEGIHLHLFGEHVGNNWLRRLQNSGSVYLHGELPYTEHFSVLKESKIVLIDHLESFDGVDEWFFAALANGSLPIVNPTPYLKEVLGNDLPFYYPTRNWNEMWKRVKFFLDFPQARIEVIHKLREETLPEHAWKSRAEDLLRLMGEGQ